MILKCPHCHKDIEMVDSNILAEEFDLSANPVALLRRRGEFPEPALGGPKPQKFYWTRDQIEKWLEARRETKLTELLGEVERTLASLPAAERSEARKRLAKR